MNMPQTQSLRTPRRRLCASLRSRKAHGHMDIAEEPVSVNPRIYRTKRRGPDGAPWSTTSLTLAVRAPLVWTHCLGNKKLVRWVYQTHGRSIRSTTMWDTSLWGLLDRFEPPPNSCETTSHNMPCQETNKVLKWCALLVKRTTISTPKWIHGWTLVNLWENLVSSERHVPTSQAILNRFWPFVRIKKIYVEVWKWLDPYQPQPLLWPVLRRPRVCGSTGRGWQSFQLNPNLWPVERGVSGVS